MRRIFVWTFLTLRFTISILLPILIRLIWGAVLLAFAGLLGLVRGIPLATEVMADEWSIQAVSWGVPPLTTERLVPAMRVWAFILIFMGWIVIGLVLGIIIVWVT